MIAVQSPPKKGKRRFWHRILRIGLWSIGIIFLLITAAILYIRTQYPEPKVLDILSEKVQTSTGMPLVIQNITWRLPLKLQINQIKLGYPESNLDKDTPFLSLDRFSVSFNLLALLRRQLDVQSITFTRPYITVNSEKLKSIKALQLTAAEGKPDTSHTGPSSNRLPISIRLSRFRLENFNAYLILPDSSGNTQIAISGLNLDLDHMQIPREVSTSLDAVRGEVHLYTKDCRINFRSENFRFSMTPEINLDVQWRKDQYWEVSGFFGIESPENPLHRLDAEINLKGYGLGDTVRVAPVAVKIGGAPVLTLTGSADHLMGQPNFKFDLQSHSLDLSKAYAILLGFNLQDLVPEAKKFILNGEWIPADGRLWGTLNDIQFQLRSRLRASFHSPQAELDSLYYKLEANGHLMTESRRSGAKTERSKRIKYTAGEIKGDMGFGSGRLIFNDSMQVETGPLAVQFSTSMDVSGLPRNGFLEGTWSGIVGGRLGLNMDWGLSQYMQPSLESLFVNGAMTLEDLEIADLPGVSSQIRGRARLQTGISLSGIDRARVKLNADFPDLTYKTETGMGLFPPLSLHSSWVFRADTDFTQIRIDSGIVKLNDLLTGRITGSMDRGANKFALDLHSRMNHDKIYDYLPNTVLPTVQGISLKGFTTLAVNVIGNITQPESLIMKDTLRIHEGEFHHAIQKLHIEGLNGEFRVAGTQNDIHGEGILSIGRLTSPMRNQPIEDSEIDFDCSYDPKTIKLNSLLFRNHSISTELKLNGFVENMDTSPNFCAGGELNFNGNEWTELMQVMDVRGTSQFRFQVDQKDSGDIIVSGTALMKEMNFRQADILALNGMNGQIPFQIEINPEGVILSDSNYHPPSWVEFENRRSQFRFLRGDLGALTIEAVEVMGYPLTNLEMDVDIHNGYAQIPWFVIHAFNGNIGGYLQVFLGTGSAETLTYEIHAQAARINAAALGDIPIKNEEEAELNAAMAFTGTGLDPSREMEVDGYFYITKIGPEFASLMLEGLDPNGNDRNIRLTRWLLNRGWKPKLFSFEMRHGYVYPSLSLTQPWFSPIRLPETLSFGRLPLQFFLENPELAKAK
jgi:hypothetical protein